VAVQKRKKMRKIDVTLPAKQGSIALIELDFCESAEHGLCAVHRERVPFPLQVGQLGPKNIILCILKILIYVVERGELVWFLK
jgi:hypothetical protein